MTRIAVVGGGTAGSVVAARLSESPQLEVLVLEAGSADTPPPQLLDGLTIQGADPTLSFNLAYQVELTRSVEQIVPRPQILGGASSVNGGYYIWPRASDLENWQRAGGDAWQPSRAFDRLRRIETDRDFPADPARGHSGPLSIQRPRQSDALSATFERAALELGFGSEVDKNSPDSPPGVGAVPSNILKGRRVSAAEAFLAPALDRGNLRVEEQSRALGVRIRDDRALGVETTRGFFEADEVILCAGAFESAKLLLLSGVGPRGDLDRLGLRIFADLPVGEGLSDHPSITLKWKGQVDSTAHDALFPAALNISLGPEYPFGDVEILLVGRPVAEMFGSRRVDSVSEPSESSGKVFELLVSLQAPKSRGRLSLRSADPAANPRIEYRYLESEFDRSRLREGIRVAAKLLEGEAFSGIFLGFEAGVSGVPLSQPVLEDDQRLDSWIAANLGTANHTCGTAAMGAVVSGDGQMLGIPNLRVADTSILPSVPSRGTFASALLVGATVADELLDSLPDA